MSALQCELMRLFHYDPLTGVFRWRVSTTNSISVGQIAGGITEGRYRKIRFQGRLRYAHHLAWLYMTRQFPRLHIDHIDGDGLNNRFVNLRDVCRSVNLQNTRHARSDNTTSFLGVQKNHKGFAARITINGKRVSLGTFTTPQLAHAAYLSAKRELHEGCTI